MLVSRLFFLLLFQVLLVGSVSAQVNDSTGTDTIKIPKIDSNIARGTSIHKPDTSINKDSSKLSPLADSTIISPPKDTTRKQIKIAPVLSQPRKQFQGKEPEFYLLVVL